MKLINEKAKSTSSLKQKETIVSSTVTQTQTQDQIFNEKLRFLTF